MRGLERIDKGLEKRVNLTETEKSDETFLKFQGNLQENKTKILFRKSSNFGKIRDELTIANDDDGQGCFTSEHQSRSQKIGYEKEER